MILGITGNRWVYKNKAAYSFCHKEIKRNFKDLMPTKVISGMAIGVDTAAVEVCLELNIPYIAAIPFVGQELFWPKDIQEKYKDLLSKADDIQIVSNGGYAAWKMQRRNEWIVDSCDILLACYDGGNGGTKNCINYAKNENKNIKLIDLSSFLT